MSPPASRRSAADGACSAAWTRGRRATCRCARPRRGGRGRDGQSPARGPAGRVAPPDPSEEDRERVREAGFPRVIEGSKGWLYLGYDMLGACLPEQPLDDVIGSLKRLRDAVESSGRKFVLIVAPDKSTMVPEN